MSGEALGRSATPPDPEHLRAVLGRCELFGALSPEERLVVEGELEWCFVPGGERVFGPGDVSDALYVVVHGRLRAYWDLDGSGAIEASELVDEIEEGGVVGDIGMLSDERHASLVLAVRDSELGRLSEGRFWALAARFPALARGVGRHAVRRLQAVLRPSPPPERVNVAVIPADPDAPADALVAALADALGALHPVLAVDPARFDAALGAGASGDDVDRWDELDRRIVRWIVDQERRHRYILYRADPEWTPWTRRCVRLADRIVVVARADADPAPGAVEARIERGSVPLDLVLVHPDHRTLPSGTHRWLDVRAGLDHVHHVRLGDPDAVRRLGRSVAGRGVGVVLGGGGARGAAQMGAVAALRDSGVPVDRVGGTSAGGGVAAMVALGWDLDTMRARNFRAFVDLAPFRHWTLPFYSMIDRARVELVARFLYGDARIEDLWLPLFCVSCDLLTGAMTIHRRGLVATAVLATTALPGVLPPVWSDGRLLVDGGVMDNNPVAVMRRLNPGPAVLIDVGQAEARMVEPPNLVRLPSNAMAAWHRFKWFGRRVRVPTIPEIVVRTMTVARPNHDVARLSDLYVRPPVDDFGLTDFRRQEELVVIGYNATLDALEQRADEPGFAKKLGVASDALKGRPRRALPAPPARRRG